MVQINSGAPSTYNKAESILELSGSGAGAEAALVRVRALTERMADLSMDAYRRQIVETACADLLAEEAPDAVGAGRRFHLRSHIVEEVRHVDDGRLADYLFYRYRYDIFPEIHKVDAYPPCVQIEPTSVCNYRCVFCYQTDPALQDRKGGHKGRMDIDTFRRVVDQIEGHVEAVTLASRGEPLLCKDIDQMLAYAAGKFLGLKINTNAWYLDERRAHALLSAEPNTVVFSADAADADLYRRLRVNGELDHVLNNIRQFAEIRAKHYPKSRTITRVSGVKFSAEQNFMEIDAFWHQYADQVAFVDYNPWESVYDAEPTGVTAPCSDLWRRMFVWWDGRANPCDVDYLSSLSVGNVLENDLSELWTGEAYERLRDSHLSEKRGRITPCNRCVVV